ncbi:MAG: DUF4914 family protein [Clostridiales bacterium]|nr:DUF4914 family protein [Clostridiales bacterium]
MKNDILGKINIPADLRTALAASPHIYFPVNKHELYELCFGTSGGSVNIVGYTIPGRGYVQEAEVVRCKNGSSVNFTDEYMRRRDPNCMFIGDDLPTDKPRFRDIWNMEFGDLRAATMNWLGEQPLVVMPVSIGGKFHGYSCLVVCPANAAFFAYALANIQEFVSIDSLEDGYTPRSIIYVAPPFRHTHFSGKQAVVHCRSTELHEVFSYNLYPGPSAKKGVFSVLLDIGENEGWITNHASAALLQTPYENEIVFMHEGASGGGKSEMLEEIRREADNRVLLARHTITGEEFYVNLSDTCDIFPIADDMVMAHSDMQNTSGKLVITDAENGWFLRVDGDNYYGNIPLYERISIHPSEPLEFFNIDGTPGATCLIWEHTMEASGKPCSNPRVIIPREMIDSIIPGDEPLEVDIRSFGVRMPPSTKENPNYGVMGFVQIVPPALAWLWRLIAPRGFKNPSIADNAAGSGLSAEGVGSYWPFATGKKVTQANMLLHQIIDTPNTLNILIPNQHIGAYEIGFKAEWITREYLARRSGTVKANHLVPARCPLFGYSLDEMKIDGQFIRRTFLRPELQSKLNEDGYDECAAILTDFFKKELQQFLEPDLDPLGRQIIELCLNDAPIEEYVKLTPINGIKGRHEVRKK